jgi:CBS domain-containing protein
MAVIKRILQVKGRQVWTTTAETRVGDALAQLAEHNVGALPVVDRDQVVGIFSERDYARKVSLEG